MARKLEILSIETFLDRSQDQYPEEPLVLEFKPCHAKIEGTFQAFKRLEYASHGDQFLRSSRLKTGDVVSGGADLEQCIDAQSVMNLQRGFWLGWPGQVTAFHRDWHLWSLLNFMLHGSKTWYLLDCRHVLPHHANLIFGDTSEIEKKIDIGKYGYKVVQKANQCIYLPGGYYHKVLTEEFSINCSVWWTPISRIQRRRSITDAWWLTRMQHHKLLKSAHVSTVQRVYDARSTFDKLYTRYFQNRYLAFCNRVGARAFLDYSRGSKLDANRMRGLMKCQEFEDALKAANAIPR